MNCGVAMAMGYVSTGIGDLLQCTTRVSDGFADDASRSKSILAFFLLLLQS